MCNKFRSISGKEWRPGDEIPLELIDGPAATGIWAGCAQQEKLDWWIKQQGGQLAQMAEPVAEIAEGSKIVSKKLTWGPAPEEAHLLFVLLPALPGKSYALTKLITTAARADQEAYFQNHRFPLLGSLENGKIQVKPPLVAPDAPPLERKEQGELF